MRLFAASGGFSMKKILCLLIMAFLLLGALLLGIVPLAVLM